MYRHLSHVLGYSHHMEVLSGDLNGLSVAGTQMVYISYDNLLIVLIIAYLSLHIAYLDTLGVYDYPH